MSKPSKGAAAFLVFFGLMFLIPGLFAAFSFLQNKKGGSPAGVAAGVSIALFIASIGLGLTLLALSGYRRMKQDTVRQEANPGTPWVWRTDWAVRRAVSLKKNVQITAWVACILCNMVLVPMALFVGTQPGEQRNLGSFIMLGFCCLGILPLFFAVRASLRHRRFGETYFELDSLPFSPGERVSGRIHLKLDGNPPHGVEVRLSCIRKITSGSGDDRSTVKTVLWQTGETVPSGVIGFGPLGRTIPVNFAIPSDAVSTSHENPSHEILWSLHAKAALQGVDYADEFEVPVFNTAHTASNAEPRSSIAMTGLRQAQPTMRAGSLVSFAVFFGIAAALFVWQGWRWSTFKSMANARGTAASAAKSPQSAMSSPVRHAAATSMTDADAERILSLVPQAQAEELLERAIAHDSRALDLFEQNVGEWVGHIRLTDRMRQLERQSEFSTDLRVRYANADINLTLDGWRKNEEAADMLIERAKNDSNYRAAAVYFLGMLAGRGVAYEKIYPVLLDYAKHDPDAAVRQWAVEGMRYLGKDEALNELFESFTHDASNQVRERAGCNISDCGNFTRLQRMRMVPKFLELLSDANTNAQMRTWCFMALREITDANVPSNPQAWQTWYGQHSAAKLAEFERLDWWRVRGDQ